MKIVSWNCNGAFRKKYHLLDYFNADVLVIQECEDPSKYICSYNKWANNYLWIGKNKNKGLGVFAREGIRLEKLNWNDNSLELFLPCVINDSFNLLAVWTKEANSPTFRYIGQFWKYLQLHKESFISKGILICGDFNSNACWDVWDRWWNHSDVVKELNDINIKSLYHELNKQEQGSEAEPTLYMQRKLEKPYHIDYFFASKELYNDRCYLEIGKPNIWLEHSDHMPLFTTIISNENLNSKPTASIAARVFLFHYIFKFSHRGRGYLLLG